jgi:hypothetical protein
MCGLPTSIHPTNLLTLLMASSTTDTLTDVVVDFVDGGVIVID